MEDKFKKTIELSTEIGKVRERTRILELILQYKESGWIDDALAALLFDDICEGEK
jgi:hypothetical protein